MNVTPSVLASSSAPAEVLLAGGTVRWCWFGVSGQKPNRILPRLRRAGNASGYLTSCQPGTGFPISIRGYDSGECWVAVPAIDEGRGARLHQAVSKSFGTSVARVDFSVSARTGSDGALEAIPAVRVYDLAGLRWQECTLARTPFQKNENPSDVYLAVELSMMEWASQGLGVVDSPVVWECYDEVWDFVSSPTMTASHSARTSDLVRKVAAILVALRTTETAEVQRTGTSDCLLLLEKSSLRTTLRLHNAERAALAAALLDALLYRQMPEAVSSVFERIARELSDHGRSVASLEGPVDPIAVFAERQEFIVPEVPESNFRESPVLNGLDLSEEAREQVTRTVDILAANAGHVSNEAFAQLFPLRAFRVAGFLSKQQEVLNVDGYQVLTTDKQKREVRLDQQKLNQLFEVSL